MQFGLTASPEAAVRARDALARSLELDDRLGEAHGLLGVFRGILDYDWPGSEAAFRRAFELSPGAASLPSMPHFDGLRGDPRFPGLLGRMHLA